MKRKAAPSWIFSAVVLFALTAFPVGLFAGTQDTIGIVRSVEGKATVTRGGEILTATVGMKLQVEDTLMTGENGSMGVILRDNSTLSIGPKSSLSVQKFLFSPADGKLGLLVRLARGSMAYISGIIGKLAPESALFETPVASIGIRGTRFAVKLDD